MVGVLGEGVFRADAFAVLAEVERAVIEAEGALFEAFGEGADEGREIDLGVLDVCDGGKAAFFEVGGSDGADAVDGADGEGSEEGDAVAVANEGEAIGLLEVATEFGEEFVGGDADAGGEAALGLDLVFDLAGEGEGGFEEAVLVLSGVLGQHRGEVEVGFID